MSEKRGHCCSECLLPSKGHGRPQGKACWRLAQVFLKVEQEEQDTTTEICKGCGRRGDGLGPVMPQIVCSTCGDRYHWLCAAVNKDCCGSKWNCARCKHEDCRKQTCEDLNRDFSWNCSDQDGKGLGLSKSNFVKRDIGGELGHEVEKIIYKELGRVDTGRVRTDMKRVNIFHCQSGEGMPPSGERRERVPLNGERGGGVPLNGERGDRVPLSGERTEAMAALSLNDESIEAMEDWLKKN